MKDRLKDHLEGWQFCENYGIKLYQKINGCSGMIHQTAKAVERNVCTPVL